MSSLHFFCGRSIIAFTLAMIVYMMPSNTLAADATEIKIIPAGNDKPADSSGAESAHIDKKRSCLSSHIKPTSQSF
jgi:hypothetical protein